MRPLPEPVRATTLNATTISCLWQDTQGETDPKEELLVSLLLANDIVLVQGAHGRRGTHEPFVHSFAERHGFTAICSFVAVMDSENPRGGVVAFIRNGYKKSSSVRDYEIWPGYILSFELRNNYYINTYYDPDSRPVRIQQYAAVKLRAGQVAD